ncbi:MAG: alpha-ketoglutarate-dependent dioxygenase AlkB [Chloroflexi bacterium]|nr:alpha-ketoglutarate-dependent dioxygenase AlkB [Chloroflexota bacterium]
MIDAELTVPGLRYIAAYLTLEEQAALAAVIDEQPWLTDLKRRVQHYGYRYNYTGRTVDMSMFLGPLPTWASRLAHQLHHDGYTPELPDQVIVNEYQPGQGISSHIDCVPCFGDTILSISLLSACSMLFTHSRSQAQSSLCLEPGSLLAMQGEARYAWKHSIPARKSDMYNDQKILRSRRLSLTFRTVIRSTA